MGSGGPQESSDDGFGESSQYAAHLDRGWSLLDRGDFAPARTSAHHAHQLRPEVPDAAMLLAAIHLAEGDPEGSVRWYDTASETDGDYVEPQIAAAHVVLYDLGDPHAALARAEQALELDDLVPAERVELGLLAVECLAAVDRPEQARKRLAGLPERPLLARFCDAHTDDVATQAVLDELRSVQREDSSDPDHEGDDDDDSAERFVRTSEQACRLSRLLIDLGDASGALRLLQGLALRTPPPQDVWCMLYETHYALGNVLAASRAAIQTLRTDTAVPAPAWLPSGASVHRRVVEILSQCKVDRIRQLMEESRPLITIQDAPAPELVLEGVDPRVPVMALAMRERHDDPTSTHLTGIAVYRRNLSRWGDSLESFEEDLQFALLDELAAYLGLDAGDRTTLGLPPADPKSMSGAAEPELVPRTRPTPKAAKTPKPAAKTSKRKPGVPGST